MSVRFTLWPTTLNLRELMVLSVFPSPRPSRGEREGEGQPLERRVAAPHPDPLPIAEVRWGEGELLISFAAALMASMIFVYPVQRQMLPAMAKRMSSSLGSGVSSSSAFAIMMMPGVQNPH